MSVKTIGRYPEWLAKAMFKAGVPRSRIHPERVKPLTLYPTETDPELAKLSCQRARERAEAAAARVKLQVKHRNLPTPQMIKNQNFIFVGLVILALSIGHANAKQHFTKPQQDVKREWVWTWIPILPIPIPIPTI